MVESILHAGSYSAMLPCNIFPSQVILPSSVTSVSACHLQGKFLQCYHVILGSQVILPSYVTLVSLFHVQGNILQCYSVILPLVEILPSDATLVSTYYVEGAVVRIWYNKTVVALVQGYNDNFFTPTVSVTLGQALGKHYLPWVNKSPYYPHTRVIIVLY